MLKVFCKRCEASESVGHTGHNPDKSQLDTLFLIWCEKKMLIPSKDHVPGMLCEFLASKLCLTRWTKTNSVWMHDCVAICLLQTEQQLDCALDLMRRLPPQQIEKNLSDLIDLVSAIFFSWANTQKKREMALKIYYCFCEKFIVVIAEATVLVVTFSRITLLLPVMKSCRYYYESHFHRWNSLQKW